MRGSRTQRILLLVIPALYSCGRLGRAGNMCCAACVVYLAVLLAMAHTSSAFIDPITLGSVAVGSAALFGYKMFACRYSECCDDKWIPANFTRLENDLSAKVFGQHLVQEIVVNALRGHFRDALQTKKALALSFHGWQGGGKNYVAQFVMNSLYKKGSRSQFVHFFSGKAHFPLQEKADIYRMHLQDWIRGNVSECDRTLFVFDEVDKMPRGVLDAVKPFLDYHEQIDGVDYRKAVFIFISNTGSKVIANKHLELWESGKRRREDLELRDFEVLIRGSAFNEQGGFEKADVIGADLVDHYVPFLPLEESHVKLCIIEEFRHRGILHPHPNHIKEVMKDVTFGAGNSMKFSKSGCKRISQQVVTLIEKLGPGRL